MTSTPNTATIVGSPATGASEMHDGWAEAPSTSGFGTLTSLARRAIWALPAWGVLLALSTLTHQPSYDTDFPAYADYITTDHFLVSHLVGSIFGAGLGVIGAFALVVLLASTRGARLAFWGLLAFTVGQVLNASVFGVAAFFQPAIGEAFLDGDEAVARTVNESVYGPALFATVGVGVLLWTSGLVQIGEALRRSLTVPAWVGRAFVIAAPVFAIAGIPFGVLQPIAGGVLAAAAFVTARNLTTRP